MSKNLSKVAAAGAYARKMREWIKRQAQVIVMYEKEDKSFRQIGEALGCSKQRAQQLYMKAKARQAKGA